MKHKHEHCHGHEEHACRCHGHEREMECHCHEQEHEKECHCHEQEHEKGCHCHEHEHEHSTCSCGHDHAHADPNETRFTLTRILLSAALWITGMLLSVSIPIAALVMQIIAYLCVGYDVLWRAGKGLFRGHMLDENFLMAIASVGAFALGEQHEAVAVMLFYQVGEMLQDMAVGKSRASIAALMAIRPDSANLEENGAVRVVSPEQVETGAVIVVRPGEKIPLDGVVIEGESTLDTAALTGESLPRAVVPGDSAPSGCVNQSALLRIRVTSPFAESTVTKILRLVEESENGKAKTERFITRFARYYTPAVVLGALLLAVIPSLIDGQWSNWIARALLLLVVSCPCALVVSVPLGFFSGIGGASRRGILIKGAGQLEALTAIDTVALDKTGTLTEGRFSVVGIDPVGDVDAAKILEIAALAERHSTHPIAQSILRAWGGKVDPTRIGTMENRAGGGVIVQVDGKEAVVGTPALLTQCGIAVTVLPCDEETSVYLAHDGRYLGRIRVSDCVKESAADAIRDLKTVGVKKTVLLSGDRTEIAEAVAARVGIDAAKAELLPQDKVDAMQNLRAEGKVLFAGDGINDAPVLKVADVGIAMGAMGSDAAIEAADVVLMDDDPRKIALAIGIARKTMAIVRQNIVLSLAVKGAVLLLGALGLASMWMAVFADVGVTAIAVLNALRALRVPA